MTQEINALRPLCDFLIVSMHWGEEYELIEPAENQISLAEFFAEQNVDLVIGHHPHVLQRFEKLPRPDGKETFCFYSLGNFVSHQRGRERILGAMMVVTFTKEEPGTLPAELSISNSGLIPVVCHYESGFTNTKVYPLYAYTRELLEKHYLRRTDSGMDFDSFKTVLNSLGTKMIMHNPMIN
jgi:poly-gamma-glutamate synthesis protein (capsule biosynthesis protein)